MENSQHLQHERGSWGTNFGFLMAAVGSAVGLGNIWGFPYKMGRYGGFAFLIVYLLLVVFVGVVVMLGELSIGRKTGLGAVGAYAKLGKKYKWIGLLGILAAFCLLAFYNVLGGLVMRYMFGFILQILDVDGFAGQSGNFFGYILHDYSGMVFFHVLFIVCNVVIVMGGIQGGIEKFCTVAMPALFFMLLFVIIYVAFQPGAGEGYAFMLTPNLKPISTFSGFLNVLKTAAGQMFFSLSLAMGAMITYGSYLGKNENLPKNSVIIVISDTMVAIMAGLAVIPAAVANGIAKGMAVSDIQLGGPNLLFATLQDVFHDMGTIGGIFGLIFYALVLIAAISSAISLIEAVSVTFIDHASAKGHERDRNKVLAVVCLAITLLACLVAVDGLGSNGIAPKDLFHINSKADWCADWLDFMDMLSEGIAMPLGALLMSIMVGWEIKPKSLYGEIDSGYNGHIHGYYTFCIKYLCPVIMFFILLVQISTFFGLGWFN